MPPPALPTPDGEAVTTDELRASEEQFRRAIEDAPIPVIMQAEDGQVLQVSRTWTELTGYHLADVPTADAWLTRAYGPRADAVRGHMHELFEGDRESLNVEFAIRTRRGADRHWSFSASAPGTLRDGRRFLVGMAVDITDRKRAEESLRESEGRLRRALAAARMGIWTLDPATGTQTRDANLNRLLGLDPVETTQPFAEFLTRVHADDRAAVEAAFAASERERRPLALEFRGVWPDGAVRWLRDQGDAFGEGGGRQMLGACVDVTDRRAAEEAVRASEERLRLIVQSATDYAIFTLAPDRTVTMWSPGAAATFDYAEEEMVGRPGDVLFTPRGPGRRRPGGGGRDGPARGAGFGRALARPQGRLPVLRVRGAHPAGARRVRQGPARPDRAQAAGGRAAPGPRRAGGPRGRAHRRAAAHAGAGPARRAARGHRPDGHHPGPRGPQRPAARHRLAGAAGAAPAGPARRAGPARAVAAGAERPGAPVRRHPHLRRPRPARPAPLRRGGAVARGVGRGGRGAPGAGRPAGGGAGGPDTACEADPFRLRQVFTNLFTNALEACPDPVRVAVACREASAGGRPALQITVRDNGPGFTEEQRRRALEPFFTTKARGTGLGLAIARRILEAHGGGIAVNGGAGGAEITLTLPRRQDGAAGVMA